MVTYIALMSFTEQGLRSLKETTRRAEQAMKLGREYGVSFKSIHWTQGPYDVIAELEGPDETSLSAFGLAVASLGNVRTQTLRAFTAQEMNGILARLP